MQVAAEYFKNTTLLLMGVICVAASVEKWNLHKRIALRMVMMAGAKPGMWVDLWLWGNLRLRAAAWNHSGLPIQGQKLPGFGDPAFLSEFESLQIFPSFFCRLRLPVFPHAALQVAPLLYVLHHGALHVALQHLHHSHGDANRGGSAPGAGECWGGVRGRHNCRQHHCWRKQANRYLSVLAFTLFSFVSDETCWYI